MNVTMLILKYASVCRFSISSAMWLEKGTPIMCQDEYIYLSKMNWQIFQNYNKVLSLQSHDFQLTWKQTNLTAKSKSSSTVKFHSPTKSQTKQSTKASFTMRRHVYKSKE
ncbi:CLUMA_CG003221, isoform A [Clunio marinus]|uniref:CLUMA_CG003221, isoform A n=1 Tax=Clunio marinus TaxID=568069 RepID=A0A1J1HN58_9DIPT|nr:CLUMA_CG003221, isoform A [Clunio marinus]